MTDYRLTTRYVAISRCRSLWLCCVLAAGFVICVLPAAANAGFIITDLGQGNTPAAISALGQYVVGQNAAGHAFLYDTLSNQTQDLGTLGGASSQANGVNDSGQVVGQAANASNVTTAFLYSNGTMQSLGTLPGGGSSGANAINDAGQVVGSSDSSHGTDAFVYDSVNKMIDITGTDAANGINASGLVTGDEPYNNFNSIAFIYDSATKTKQNLIPDDGYSGGNAINASGDIVGFSESASDYHLHAFLYNGSYNNLGDLPGYDSSAALGINASGQVVGDSYNAGQNDHSAFIYSGGVMTDLTSQLDNGAGWSLKYAYAISDSGQIVGEGTYNGVEHGFLLTADATVTPEPGSLALWGLAAAGMTLRAAFYIGTKNNPA